LSYEGVAIVLGMCGTNVYHPLRREWALLCVRHACETSESIRSFIESLQLQDTHIVDQNMKDSGMRVEVDQNTGKLRFQKSKS
jgi:hypothetical protein